ncbi:hypothetical protein P691DRAFT_812841 [Macrolepiota fuliginosa MF-IS2]|uniref:Uncharacterized protein n=1 Tax=Macrolepiota fuliginosa MF-IS2 TaxID=1400762 RepID=A0A9P5X140_9AGAR|nr:hypothetical protein P691DRAFT_812841 [Macrolepiota fuliginosa MF-IS2]
MLLLSLLLSLLLTFIVAQSAPINSPPSKAFGADPSLYHPILRRDLPQITKPNNDRTTSGILWSCLATIVACTWSAVHPNLSGPRDSGFQRLRRRVTTMICIIIAPEFVAIWAMRQRLAARRLKKDFNDRFHGGVDPDASMLTKIKQWFAGPEENPREGWTLTHGFFIQMGGFMVFHNGKPVKVLTYKRMLASIQKGEIDIPAVHEKDISDRDKGDFLTKVLVVGQTTWFVVQCVARWCLRLPLAELEVLTLAFAALNGVIYWIWWAKPQGVQESIGLPLKTAEGSSLHRVDTSTDNPESKLSQPMVISTPNDPTTATRGETAALNDNPALTEANLNIVNLDARGHPLYQTTPVDATLGNPESNPPHPTDDSTLKNHTITPRDDTVASKSAELDFALSVGNVVFTTKDGQPTLRIIWNPFPVCESDDDHEGEMDEKKSFHLLRELFHIAKVPFHNPSWFLLPVDYLVAAAAAFALPHYFLVRTLFKLVQPTRSRSHCGAEFFIVGRSRVPMFYADGNPNRLTTIPLIAIGIIFGAFHLILWSSSVFPTFLSRGLWKWSALFVTVAPALMLVVLSMGNFWFPKFVGRLVSVMIKYSLVLYIVARCILIYLSFSTIFSLPQGVLQDIQWEDLIPHDN